ncbi:MAG: helix-hairpin-helix domain-containing protein, partial [Pseudomonadota bacterium]
QAAVLARATGPSGAAALSAARAMRSARVISGDAAAEDAAAGDAAAVGTEELAPPDIAAALEAPLFCVEAAALELLETAGFEATSENRPAAFEDPAPETASDDLALIQGVGPETAELLVAEGVRQFDTLARLDPADAAWLDRALGLGGRVVRERWIPQAQRWAAHKAAGGLHLGPEGRWTAKPAADPDNLVDLANVARGREAGADGTAAEGYLGGVEADALAILSAGGPPPGHAPAVELLSAASAGAPDDLQLIRGVDSRRETRMNALGLFHFSQLASLSAADLAWLDQALGLGGAAISERWREQAETLAAQKNDGDLQLGADGSWTMSARARALREVGALARAAPYTRAEIDATRLINSGIEAEDADRPNILLSDPSRGAKDDLKAIEGVGPRLEALLNDLGVYYYDQIASLSAEDIAWIDAKLRFKGRIVRDRWVVQAAELGRRAAEAGAGGGAGGDART